MRISYNHISSGYNKASKARYSTNGRPSELVLFEIVASSYIPVFGNSSSFYLGSLFYMVRPRLRLKVYSANIPAEFLYLNL